MKQHDIIAAREVLLKKIRNALLDPTENSADGLLADEALLVDDNDSIEMTFATALVANGGSFFYADNRIELTDAIQSLVIEKKWKRVFCRDMNLVDLLNTEKVICEPDSDNLPFCEAVLCECEFLSARTGSVVLSSALSTGRRAVAMNDVLLVVAHLSQILYDVPDVLKAMQTKYGDSLPSSISFVTGPSRTADIEKTIIMGAHGSREVYVFLTGFDFSEE